MKQAKNLTLFTALALATLPVSAAMAQASGVANPPDAMMADSTAPKPAVTAAASTAAEEPLPPPVTSSKEPPFAIIGPVSRPDTTAVERHHVPMANVTAEELSSPNADSSLMVTEIVAAENELPAGTLLHVRLHQELATDKTPEGTALLGELAESVKRNGRVLLPAGTPFSASVTAVRGGKRIRGAAMLHIESRNVTIGTMQYPVHASVIDTDQFGQTRVDSEGNIIRKDHVGATLAAMSLTTGGAAAAGGVLGGVPGALIGAGVGAGVSTVWWLKQDRQMHLAPETTIVFSLTSPLFLNTAKTVGAE